MTNSSKEGGCGCLGICCCGDTGGGVTCTRLKVTLLFLYVRQAGEPSAEWHMSFNVGGSNWVYVNNDVVDNTTYTLNKVFYIPVLSKDTNFEITAGGYEEDLGGWPDYNDPLPGAFVVLGNQNNWNVGSIQTIGASDGEFDYELYYKIECMQETSTAGPMTTALQQVRDWTVATGRPPIPVGDDNKALGVLVSRLAKFRQMKLAALSGDTLVFNGYDSDFQAVMNAVFPTAPAPPPPAPTPGPPPV